MDIGSATCSQSGRDKGPAPNVSACEVLLNFEMMFSGVHEAIIKLIYIII